MNTLENLSLFDINDLYQLQNQHFQKVIVDINIDNEPYQHFEVENLFHNDFYEFMKQLMPEFNDMEQFIKFSGVPSHYPKERHAFFIKTSDHKHDYLYKKVIDPKMRYHYIKLYQWFDQILCPAFLKILDLDQQDYTNNELAYVIDVPGFALKAHTDIPQKIMTVLCYMPDDYTLENCGTNVLIPKNFQVLEKPAKVDSDFNIVKTAKFIPNNTFCFRRSDYSFHNVTDNNAQGHRKFLLFTAINSKKL